MASRQYFSSGYEGCKAVRRNNESKIWHVSRAGASSAAPTALGFRVLSAYPALTGWAKLWRAAGA